MVYLRPTVACGTATPLPIPVDPSSSAILSAIMFNALIIVALIPLALKGVRYRPIGAAALLRRNLWALATAAIGAVDFGFALHRFRRVIFSS